MRQMATSESPNHRYATKKMYPQSLSLALRGIPIRSSNLNGKMGNIVDDSFSGAWRICFAV